MISPNIKAICRGIYPSAGGNRKSEGHIRSFLGFKNERQTIPHISVKAAKKMATPVIERSDRAVQFQFTTKEGSRRIIAGASFVAPVK